ncbi:MAG TPA: hypothetical protein VL283_03010 [Candidatus Baltobacteraceae bacterium]|nr:hypothetical protein [Candidatus Baltobacteraceae bacterium]
MRHVLLWMFTVTPETDLFERLHKIAARLILLAAPVLLAAYCASVDFGWGVCAGMLLLGGAAFISTTWYRWNVIEAPKRDELARARMLSRLRRGDA